MIKITKTFDEIIREQIVASDDVEYFLGEYDEDKEMYNLTSSMDYKDLTDKYIENEDFKVGDIIYDANGVSTGKTIASIVNANIVFKDYVKSVGITIDMTDASILTTYVLLSARYGNSSISNNDMKKFLLKLSSTIFQYGPSWEKRLDVQSTLRQLSEDEIITGTRMIANHAYNPSDIPEGPNVVGEEIQTVNDQNVNKYTKSKVESYGLLMSLLETDVTEEYIKQFRLLFQTILTNVWYDINY